MYFHYVLRHIEWTCHTICMLFLKFIFDHGYGLIFKQNLNFLVCYIKYNEMDLLKKNPKSHILLYQFLCILN